MTQEITITEMNEAIALFMGLKSFEDSRYGKLWPNPASDGVHEKTAFSLKYHKSWDWLMPVVEKISKLHKSSYGFTIDPHSIEIRDYSKAIEKVIVNIVNDDSYPMIEMYYTAVVDFIKWYNKNRPQ